MTRLMLLLRPIAFTVIVALALTGCGPSAGSSDSFPIDPAALQKVEQLRSLPFDASSVAIVTDVLQDAGVAIEEDWSGAATEMIRTTSWQAQNMAVEAANEGGLSGAELAAVAPTADGAPPIGYLISAWAIDYDSDAARFAHALLGDQDFHHPETILFSSLVTTLFLADATADYDATDFPVDRGMGPAIDTVAFHSDLITSPCSTAASFIQDAIATVMNALTADTSGGGFFGFVGKIWNTVVNLAVNLVLGLVKIVTGPIVQVIVTVLGAIETIRQVSTYLMPWRATLEPKPDTNRFGIGDEQVRGGMTLTVLDNRLPIPAGVLDCAAFFDVNLRDAGSATGSTVAWTPTNMARPDLSTTDTAGPVLDKDQKAQYDYLTGQESAKAAKGEEHAGLLKLVASVQRNDIERVRKLFTALVFDQIPASIRGIVERVAAPILDAATTHLTSITDVRATGYVAITFHSEPPASTPTAAPTKPPADASSGSCPAGLLEYHTAIYAPTDVTVNSITPAQFLSDYSGVFPNLTGGIAPTCAFQFVSDLGIILHEKAYFVGANESLVTHAVSVMNAAGYSDAPGFSTGFYQNEVGFLCAAIFTPHELVVAPGVVFLDQVVEIVGPRIGSF